MLKDDFLILEMEKDVLSGYLAEIVDNSWPFTEKAESGTFPTLKDEEDTLDLLEDDLETILNEPVLIEPPLDTDLEADFPVVNEVMDTLNVSHDIKIYLNQICLSHNHDGLCGCPLHSQPEGSCGEGQPGGGRWNLSSSPRRVIFELPLFSCRRWQ